MKVPNRANEFVSTIEHDGFRNKTYDELIKRLRQKYEKVEDIEKNEIPL